jgi:hypothetical protein
MSKAGSNHITRRGILAGVVALSAATPAAATIATTTDCGLLLFRDAYAAAKARLEQAAQREDAATTRMWAKFPSPALRELPEAEESAIEDAFGVTAAVAEQETINDEMQAIEDRITQTPARDLAGVAIKLRHIYYTQHVGNLPLAVLLRSALNDIETMIAQAAMARRET